MATDHDDAIRRAALGVIAASSGHVTPATMANVVEPIDYAPDFWLRRDLARRLQLVAMHAHADWLDFRDEVGRLIETC